MSDDAMFSHPVVLKIREGTKNSGDDLCRTCKFSHRFAAARSNRETVLCTRHYDTPIRITEPIANCNKYRHANEPDLYDMKEIAWEINLNKGGTIGFMSPEQIKKREDRGV